MTQAIANSTTAPEEEIRLWDTIPRMFETGVILIVLFLFSEALLSPLLASETKPDGNPILRIMWLPIYALVLGFAIWKAKTFAAICLRMPFLVALMAVTAASVLWSIDSGLTFRRAIAVVMTTGMGLHLANRYNWNEMLTLFGLIWFFLAALSFVIAIGMPTIGIEQEGDHIGAWRGLWFQKNAFGGHMSRATLLFAFLIISRPDMRKIWIVGLLMAIALVLLSTSKTSLVGMVLGFAILGVGVLMKRGARLALVLSWVSVLFMGVLGSIIVFAPELIGQVLGRDLTLTGRTDIWQALGYVIAERPWLGHGYGAFWNEGSAPAEYVKDLVEWDVPTAHNGWMETWLSVGMVGMGLFAVGYFVTIIRAFFAAVSSWNGLFALGFLAQFFLFNLSESMILQQNSIVWVTYIALAAALVRQSVSDRQSRPGRGSAGRQRELLPVAGGPRHPRMSGIMRPL